MISLDMILQSTGIKMYDIYQSHLLELLEMKQYRKNMILKMLY